MFCSSFFNTSLSSIFFNSDILNSSSALFVNMAPRRPQIRDEEWESHRDRIRQLYLVENLSLANLVSAMESLGFRPSFVLQPPINALAFLTHSSKAQLEYKLKKWDFRKHLRQEDWRSIDYKITKRKREGKESHVIFSGAIMNPEKVKKEINRHREVSIFNRLRTSQCLSLKPVPLQLRNVTASSPRTPEDLQISTPVDLPVESCCTPTVRLDNLPWCEFQVPFYAFLEALGGMSLSRS